jgi:hypothetical protein
MKLLKKQTKNNKKNKNKQNWELKTDSKFSVNNSGLDKVNFC